MTYAIILAVLALAWDAYALNHWKHRDYTVSEFIYKFIHRYPIVAVGMGILVAIYFQASLVPICVGITVGHLLWKA